MKIYKFNELKESKIIFDRKPPKFSWIMTLITFSLLVTLIILATVSYRDFAVRTSGIITNDIRMNIMNEVSAPISRIHVSDGQRVEVGEVLIELNTFQIDIQIDQQEAALAPILTRIELTEQLIFFTNNFRLDNPDSMINPFNSEDINEIIFYNDANALINFVNEQLNREPEYDDEDEAFTQDDLNDLKGQFLSHHFTNLNQLNAERINIESQINMNERLRESFLIIATVEGHVNFNMDLTIGMVLQAGSLLGTVSSNENDSMFIDSMISAIDISRVNVGDYVDITIAGAIQSEFGTIRGIVVHIGSDSIQTEVREVFFRIRIEPLEYYLTGRRGQRVYLTNGMIAESRIIYRQTRWIYWIFEQVRFR